MKGKFYFMTLALLVISCKSDKKTENPTDNKVSKERQTLKQNTLSDQEKNEGWLLLFDGKTTDGWHLYNKPETKSTWVVKDGALTCDPFDENAERGDLVSDKEFKNYDFTFEWKVTESGNSGVFINVVEEAKTPQAWFTGPEYQLLDSKHIDYEIEVKRSGCLYGFSPQVTPTMTKPAGQWNTSRIKQVDGKVEFYLNGNLTAKVDFHSKAWKDFTANSNFKNFPQFGASTAGHIGLQIWSSPVWFRNLKIKEL